jgi:hypothetical protein
MGMARDMRQRVTLARVDDDAKRRKVEMARDIIYKKNYAINSAPVEAILKDESLVPSSVSTALFTDLADASNMDTERFLFKARSIGL